MSEETTNNDLAVSFLGTRRKDKKQQLLFQVNDEVFLVDVDSKSFLAGERIVRKAQAAIALHEKAVKQGLVKA